MLVAESVPPRTHTLLFFAATGLVIMCLVAAEHYGAQARILADSARAGEIAAESKAFCSKYAVDAAQQESCISDLQILRNRHGRRVMADAEGIL